MSKYYALKVEGKIVFIIPWDKQQDPFLSDFQFAIAKGRKLWDKRNYKKEQDINREIDRSMKGKN